MAKIVLPSLKKFVLICLLYKKGLLKEISMTAFIERTVPDMVIPAPVVNVIHPEINVLSAVVVFATVRIISKNSALFFQNRLMSAMVVATSTPALWKNVAMKPLMPKRNTKQFAASHVQDLISQNQNSGNWMT